MVAGEAGRRSLLSVRAARRQPLIGIPAGD
jgi:hypothetical protein